MCIVIGIHDHLVRPEHAKEETGSADSVTVNSEAIPGGKFHKGHFVPSVFDEPSIVTYDVGPNASAIVNNYSSDCGRLGPECITSSTDLSNTFYVGMHINVEECEKKHLSSPEKNGPCTVSSNHMHGINGTVAIFFNTANHTDMVTTVKDTEASKISYLDVTTVRTYRGTEH